MIRTVSEYMRDLENTFKLGMLVQLALLGPLLTLAIGCPSTSQRRGEVPLVAESDAKTDDEILYAAVLDVFAEQGFDVELEDRKRGMVLTEWTEVNREVRHRWVGRVIRSNVGLVLTVDSKYERREGAGPQMHWVEADDPYTLEEKKRDEQRIGAAIQKRFKALGGGR